MCRLEYIHTTQYMNDELYSRLCNDKEYLHEVLVSNFIENPFDTSLPSDITTILDDRLGGFHILQVTSVNDITKASRSSEDATKHGNRMLRLTLTDGKQKVLAYEYRKILEFDFIFEDSVKCLSKIALFNSPVIKRGTLWLVPENVKILFQGFRCLTFNPIVPDEENPTCEDVSRNDNFTRNDDLRFNEPSITNGNKNSILFNSEIAAVTLDVRQSLGKGPNEDSYKPNNININNINNPTTDTSQPNKHSSNNSLKPDTATLNGQRGVRAIEDIFEKDIFEKDIFEKNIPHEAALDEDAVEDDILDGGIFDEDILDEDILDEDILGLSFYNYVAHSGYREFMDDTGRLKRAFNRYSVRTVAALCSKHCLNNAEIYLLASRMPYNAHLFKTGKKKLSFYGTVSKAVLLEGHTMSSQLWLLELLVTAQPVIYSLACQKTLELFFTSTSGLANVQINVAVMLYAFTGHLDVSVYGYKGHQCFWLSQVKNLS